MMRPGSGAMFTVSREGAPIRSAAFPWIRLQSTLTNRELFSLTGTARQEFGSASGGGPGGKQHEGHTEA